MRGVIFALWHACGLVDRLPEYSTEDRRWYTSGLGCRLRISKLALRLEDRYGEV